MTPTPNRTPQDATDPRPLHERIAADLRRRIMTGEIAPGDKLPSTARLVEQFDASNATVQKAIGLLKEEGIAVGRSGSGVIAREHRRRSIRPEAYSAPAEPGQPYRWISEASKRGMTPTIELIDVGERVPPAEVRDAMELADGEPAAYRKQLLSLDGVPCELVTSYYPLELARGTALLERRRIKGGTPTLLAEMGYPPRRTEDSVMADVATQEEYTALRLPSALPVLLQFRVVYSNDDRPIEVSQMTKAGHLYKIHYSF